MASRIGLKFPMYFLCLTFGKNLICFSDPYMKTKEFIVSKRGRPALNGIEPDLIKLRGRVATKGQEDAKEDIFFDVHSLRPHQSVRGIYKIIVQVGNEHVTTSELLDAVKNSLKDSQYVVITTLEDDELNHHGYNIEKDFRIINGRFSLRNLLSSFNSTQEILPPKNEAKQEIDESKLIDSNLFDHYYQFTTDYDDDLIEEGTWRLVPTVTLKEGHKYKDHNLQALVLKDTSKESKHFAQQFTHFLKTKNYVVFMGKTNNGSKVTVTIDLTATMLKSNQRPQQIARSNSPQRFNFSFYSGSSAGSSNLSSSFASWDTNGSTYRPFG